MTTTSHPYRAASEIVPHKRPWWIKGLVYLDALTPDLFEWTGFVVTEFQLKRRMLGGHWERLHCGDWDTTVTGRWERSDRCHRHELPIVPIPSNWVECEDWP